MTKITQTMKVKSLNKPEQAKKNSEKQKKIIQTLKLQVDKFEAPYTDAQISTINKLEQAKQQLKVQNVKIKFGKQQKELTKSSLKEIQNQMKSVNKKAIVTNKQVKKNIKQEEVKDISIDQIVPVYMKIGKDKSLASQIQINKKEFHLFKKEIVRVEDQIKLVMKSVRKKNQQVDQSLEAKDKKQEKAAINRLKFLYSAADILRFQVKTLNKVIDQVVIKKKLSQDVLVSGSLTVSKKRVQLINKSIFFLIKGLQYSHKELLATFKSQKNPKMKAKAEKLKQKSKSMYRQAAKWIQIIQLPVENVWITTPLAHDQQTTPLKWMNDIFKIKDKFRAEPLPKLEKGPDPKDVMFTQIKVDIKMIDRSHLLKTIKKYYYMKPTNKGVILLTHKVLKRVTKRPF